MVSVSESSAEERLCKSLQQTMKWAIGTMLGPRLKLFVFILWLLLNWHLKDLNKTVFITRSRYWSKILGLLLKD